MFGIEKVKSKLVEGYDDGARKLFVFSTCKNTEYQFTSWRKKTDQRGNIIGYEDHHNDLLDCVRYLCTRNDGEGVGWVPPPEENPFARGLTPTQFKKSMAQIGNIFLKGTANEQSRNW
jgi:hypothetical protein